MSAFFHYYYYYYWWPSLNIGLAMAVLCFYSKTVFFGPCTAKYRPIWMKFCAHLLLYRIHLWADIDCDRCLGGSRPNQNDYVFVILVTHPKSYTETTNLKTLPIFQCFHCEIVCITCQSLLSVFWHCWLGQPVKPELLFWWWWFDWSFGHIRVLVCNAAISIISIMLHASCLHVKSQ